MTITYQEYKDARQSTIAYRIPTAKSALQALRYNARLAAWRKNIGMSKLSYGYGEDDPLHVWRDANGYEYRFICENDDLPSDFWEDEGEFTKRSLSRYEKPEYFEHGATFSRYSGNGMQCVYDLASYHDRNYYPHEFDISERFVRQYYDNKAWGKHEAYTRMVQSVKDFFEGYVEHTYKKDIYWIAIYVYDAEGEEIDFCGLGGCDEDYVESGAAFFDNGLLEEAQEIAARHRATITPASVAENYTQGAFI